MSWDSVALVDTRDMRAQGRHDASSSIGVFRLEEGIPLTRWVGQDRARVSSVGAVTSAERQPLIKENRRRRWAILDAYSIILGSGVCLWISVIAVLCVLFWSISTTITAARAEFRPYVEEAIGHTMQILRNADQASTGASGVMDGAKELSAQAVPAIERALNQSMSMIDRLERLAANPVLQISMQQGVGR